MTEMLRHAHPDAKAAGAFSPGKSENTWRIFMDRALGQAAVAKGDSRLSRQIEQAMRSAQNGNHPVKGTPNQ